VKEWDWEGERVPELHTEREVDRVAEAVAVMLLDLHLEAVPLNDTLLDTVPVTDTVLHRVMRLLAVPLPEREEEQEGLPETSGLAEKEGEELAEKETQAEEE